MDKYTQFESGFFIISLDFELLWGVRDKRSINTYGEHILGVRRVIPALLALFEKYGVKATFATVGFLFADDKQKLLASCPQEKPGYFEAVLSPYNGHFDLLKSGEKEDPYHFGGALIEQIKAHPQHEIGTHTFSHYYCLETGQNTGEFEQDLEAAKQIARQKQIDLKSIVFPRNQYSDEYIEVCRRKDIDVYRGTEKTWFYQSGNKKETTLFKRAFRLIDTYLNISGHHCYSLDVIRKSYPCNIPSSRFLRPYNSSLKILEFFKLKRILKSMDYAAKNKLVYHLWWHPHNFGINQKENFDMLEKILEHYQNLNDKHNFQSETMSGLAAMLKNIP